MDFPLKLPHPRRRRIDARRAARTIGRQIDEHRPENPVPEIRNRAQAVTGTLRAIAGRGRTIGDLTLFAVASQQARELARRDPRLAAREDYAIAAVLVGFAALPRITRGSALLLALRGPAQRLRGATGASM